MMMYRALAARTRPGTLTGLTIDEIFRSEPEKRYVQQRSQSRGDDVRYRRIPSSSECAAVAGTLAHLRRHQPRCAIGT